MYVVRIRRGYEQEWLDSNPVLAEGELGFVVDLKIIKVGDGVTPYEDLEDFLAQGPQGIQGIQGPQGALGPGITVVDTVDTAANLPPAANLNDMIIAEDTLHGHVWDGAEWLDVGPIAGPQGATGPQGPAGDAGPQGPAGDAGVWWYGTQAQYDALNPKDPDTLYVIVG